MIVLMYVLRDILVFHLAFFPEVIVAERGEIIIQLINEWDAVRDIEPGHSVIRYPVEIFDEGPQRIPMSGQDDALVFPKAWNDFIPPILKGTLFRIDQTLRHGQVFVADRRILGIVTILLVCSIRHGRRPDIGGSPPLRHLLFPELLRDLILVQALKSPVVALIELP